MDRKLVRGILGAVMAVGLSGAPVLASPSGYDPTYITFECRDGIYYQAEHYVYGEPDDQSLAPGAQAPPEKVFETAIGTCGGATASVRGTAFEDKNENGRRDAGEPTMAGAWWKVSDGGSWFVCGYTGADSTYGVPVTQQGMTYFVYAIAPKGWRTTTPMVKTKTVSTTNGYAYLYNDLGFVRDANATTVAACDQYSPKVVTPPSILMTANSTGTFKTLVAAAVAAGLANTLNNDGALTVFAPTDAAFAKLPAGTVEALLKDPVALGNILKYHVIGDKVPASQVVKATELTTLQGGKLKVSLAGGGVMINNAQVLATDIMASNGIVHVIDTVLIP